MRHNKYNESSIKVSRGVTFSQRTREARIHQLHPRPSWSWIPGDLRVRLKNMGGGTVVLCASSSFQVGILVSISRVGKGANPGAHHNLCKVGFHFPAYFLHEPRLRLTTDENTDYNWVLKGAKRGVKRHKINISVA